MHAKDKLLYSGKFVRGPIFTVFMNKPISTKQTCKISIIMQCIMDMIVHVLIMGHHEDFPLYDI